MIRIILAPIAAIVVVYLFGSFIAWDFNAGNWGGEERRSAACAALISAAGAVAVTFRVRK